MTRPASPPIAALAGAALLFVAPSLAPPAAAQSPRPDAARATEIALGSLDAVRRHWALDRYAEAGRLRARINLRGGAGIDVGVTANAVVDRRARRWRLDASGDVGPLTLVVNPARALLYVQPLDQRAEGASGGLSGAFLGANPAAEVDRMRANLADGYGALTLRGEESVGGVPAWRLEESPEPGVTATYWIDQRTSLPLRVALDRPGRDDLRVEFGYGAGPRPTRVAAYVQGRRDVQVVASPAYDGSGRARHVHVEATVAGGGSYAVDLTLDWSPSVAPGFFDWNPPGSARSVPFPQLLQGVLFSAAGKLGGLLSAFMGGR